MKRVSLIIFIGLILLPLTALAQSVSDYLILQNINSYKLETRQKVIGGFIGGPRTFDGASVIAPTGHFYVDHNDKTYEAYYEGGNSLNSITVQITQHAGGDSDRWILHELDANFRNYYGNPGNSYVMRQINGNFIMAVRSGGGKYQWLSGNKVTQIAYTDLQLTKPEPLEVIQAYLAKHPSTLSQMTSADIRTNNNISKWIKDEMERRLWLCDKWNAQFQSGKVTQDDLLQALVKSMTVFLNYRQKYFNVSATEDIRALEGYWENNDNVSIQAKLSSYKAWWMANKAGAINL